ncbi:MAG: MlaD family protein [Solirubrobacteraceae bacterium]
MRRRRASSIAANPVLIGAATTLVVIVAVFLAYNANEGLPFVPTYQLQAEVPDAANLVKGNDVRIAGTRVGTVTTIAPQKHSDGSVTAVLTLKMQTSVKPLPKDSTVLIRPRSALGLKYVEITKGNPSSGGFPDGATIPLQQATPIPVEIDQVFNTFDEPTRRGIQGNVDEFGNAFAGRGADLNVTISNLPNLLSNLEPVMRNLAAKDTRLDNFFKQLGNVAGQVAPVAEQQASAFVNLDITFGALASVARPYIQDSITGGPPALDAAIQSFPIQRAFLANSTALFRDLQPGVKALAAAAPDLADALTLGVPVLEKSPAFNDRLGALSDTIKSFSNNPVVPIGIKRLAQTMNFLDPTVSALTPTQTVCNYVSLFFRNTASLLSEGDSIGTWQRFIIIPAPRGPNNEGSPASAPANGPSEKNHLHTTPYPKTAAPGQGKVCAAGNEKFVVGKTVLSNPPVRSPATTEATKP